MVAAGDVDLAGQPRVVDGNADGITSIDIGAHEFQPRIPGDVTGDGSVGVPDLLAVIDAWGQCPAPPSPCPADIAPHPHGDGTVGVADLLMVINNWG